MKKTLLMALAAFGGIIGVSKADVTIGHTDRGAFVEQIIGTQLVANDGFKATSSGDSGDNYQIRVFNGDLIPPTSGGPLGPLETERNYHTFDLSGLSGSISAATLRIWADLDAYDSSAPSETVGLFEVDAPAATLASPTADNGGLAVYGDLGSGDSYGDFVTTAADSETYIDVVLNAAALADLNAAVGIGSWSVGGALQTIDGSYNPGGISERVLKNDSSTSVEPSAQLVLTGSVVPEPTAAVLGLLAFGYFAARRQRG